MNAARLLAVAALVAAVVVVAVVLTGNGAATKYDLLFENAGQLVNDNDVQIGGRRVGRVTDIALTEDSRARVSIEVEDGFTPLREGTRALIRQTSLSGVANRYITLTPGPESAPELEDGATLGLETTTAPVELDQLFNTLDARTRKALQDVIQGSADQFRGKGPQANAAAKYFNPALTTTRAVVEQLTADQEALTRFLRNTSQTTRTIAQRRGTLTDLVTNTSRTNNAIGDEATALADTLELLPDTLRRGNSTFVNLRATLDDLQDLVDVSKPATRRLAPFLRELRPLVEDARPTIADLRTLVRRPGAGNDLTDLTLQQPRLVKVAEPSFENSTKALRRSTPVLSYARAYWPDFTQLLRSFGQATANYDANGHFARVFPTFNNFRFVDDAQGGELRPVPSSQRFNGLQVGAINRCPGAATQAPADGSAPWRDTSGDLDCEPQVVPPGP